MRAPQPLLLLLLRLRRRHCHPLSPHLPLHPLALLLQRPSQYGAQQPPANSNTSQQQHFTPLACKLHHYMHDRVLSMILLYSMQAVNDQDASRNPWVETNAK
jgi:hypothetical protein